MLSVVLSVSTSVIDLVDIASVVDAPGPVPGSVWTVPLWVVPTAAAGALGWWVSGPAPALPEARAVPPPGVPVLSLSPGARAVFTAALWSRTALVLGAVNVAAAVLSAFIGHPPWQGAVLLFVSGVFKLLTARTLLRVGGRGVEFTLPLLGGLRRAVMPFSAIRFAETRPGGHNPGPIGNREGFGHVAGPGPVLVLYLTDGRWLVYSTRDAETGAALVNGALNRERQGTGGC